MFVSVSAGLAVAQEYYPPASLHYAQIAAAGSILPGGRILQPFGTQFETGPGPFGIALSPKGVVATANIGYERFGVTLIEQVRKSWTVRHLWARTPDSRLPEATDPEWRGVFFGIAFDSEHSVWVSEGDSGKVRLLDTRSGNHEKIVDLNQAGWKHSFSGDLAFDPVRRLLYVLDQAHFRLVIVDAKKGQVQGSVTVGRLPFSIALSPDGGTAYVTNVGIFQYAALADGGREGPAHTGLRFPAFGFPSIESRDGARQGTVVVPGLGDPNVRESNSLCIVDVRTPEKPSVVQWIRTGSPIDGSVVVGGSAPSGVLATGERVYVSNAHSDSITVVSPANNVVVAEIPLRIQGLEQFRGILPAGMAFDSVTKWLLVAEAGLNAVGIIDTEKNALIGHIPVGWMPTRIVVAEDRVFVTNAKGRGTGPKVRQPLVSFGEVPMLHRGSVSTFVMPAASDLPKLTRTVYAANGMLPATRAGGAENPPAMPDGIRHVVLIVKENRTFDEVLGDIGLTTGNAAGDNPNRRVQASPRLARYGLHGLADGKRRQFSVKDVAITPNHHALAQGWAYSDNFYADSDVSLDGHHWLTGAYPDLLTESGLLAAYGGQRAFVLDASAPGRLIFPGERSSVHPEEQPEAGSLWHHLDRHGIRFRSFGEGFELAGVVQDRDEEPAGARVLTNVPMPEPLYRNTSRGYPGFNLNIPDQYRADRFIAEMEERYRHGEEPLPQFIFIHLPNDHTGAERERDGYPYQASFVADNDLALGRILEYLSHTQWWRQMAVFVTESGSQSGLDHIDSHRTVLLAAGPWIRRNYVSHTNSSFPGLLRTIFELLHLPALNLMDATAADLRDLFTTEPDYTPYDVLLPDQRVFDPAVVRMGNPPMVRMEQPK